MRFKKIQIFEKYPKGQAKARWKHLKQIIPAENYQNYLPNEPNSADEDVDQESWIQEVCQGKEKVSRMRFYIEDVISGPNTTVEEVPQAPGTNTSPTSFGLIRVMDDLITSKPNSNSDELGRLQGLLISSDLVVSALTMNLNIIFTYGMCEGSTISFMGRAANKSTNREMAIVGGTGIFGMAHGYVKSNIYTYDEVNYNYMGFEYTLYVTYANGSSVGMMAR